MIDPNDYSKNDFLRKKMVREQLRTRDITDERVLKVMEKVPREHFVPLYLIDSAFEDNPLPVEEGQTISQPYMVALMTQELEVSKEHIVLEIGTGTGYQTAILAELAKEVYTIERIEKLSKKAQKRLAELGYDNIHFKIGDGTQGWEGMTFDRIIVTASAPSLPEPYKRQLKDGGIIIIPIGHTQYTQQLLKIIKIKDKFITKKICGCVFVKLIGEFGWKER